jgi:hypothetical protein
MERVPSPEPIAVNPTSGQTTGSPEQQQDARSKPTIDVANVIQDGETLEEVVVAQQRDKIPDLTSISSFLARNQVSGFAKTNRFFVKFNLDGLFDGLTSLDYANYLTFRCESVDFPGRELSVTDARIYGPIYKIPTISSYPDVNMTLLCDSSLSQKQLFEIWMNRINPKTSYDFEYRESYVRTIEIHQINEINDVMHTIELVNAFPTSVASLQSNWADDGYHKLQVTFAYDYWKSSVDKIQEQTQYDLLRTDHISKINSASLATFKRSFNDDRNLEHQRKVRIAAEESTGRFKSIITNLK